MTEIAEGKAFEIITAHLAARASMRDAVVHAIRCGELLIEAKANMAHGAFGVFCKSLPFSDRTGRGYMRLARLDTEERQRVADLSLRGALALLSSPRGVAEAGAMEGVPDEIGLAEKQTLAYGIWPSSGFEYSTIPSPGVMVLVEPWAKGDHFFVTKIDTDRWLAEGICRPIKAAFVGAALELVGVHRAGYRWSICRAERLLDRNTWVLTSKVGDATVRTAGGASTR